MMFTCACATIRTQHVQGCRLRWTVAVALLNGSLLGRAQAFSWGSGTGSDGGQFWYMKSHPCFCILHNFQLHTVGSPVTTGIDKKTTTTTTVSTLFRGRLREGKELPFFGIRPPFVYLVVVVVLFPKRNRGAC